MISSADEFVLLRTSDDSTDYLRAANESASLQVWIDVVTRYPDMSVWVAHNKTIPNEIINILSNHADPQVRSMIASKRKTPHDVLCRLATDDADSVRNAVARNPKCTEDIYRILANDKWESIRSHANLKLQRGGNDARGSASE